MRIFLLPLVLLVCACKSGVKSPNQITGDTSKINATTNQPATRSRDYSSFNEFLDSIRCNSLTQVPVKVDNAVIKKIGKDTTMYSFTFSGIRFTYTSILATKESDEPCDSLFSYKFTINDKEVHAKSLSDSLRNHGFKFDKLCGLRLQLTNARKFELSGVTYLTIPSTTTECIGAFCRNEIDHIFVIGKNGVTYLTIDGWQICNVNNDNDIEQIVFNDDPIQQYPFLNKIKSKSHNKIKELSVTKCANIQIWTLKNNQWIPLRDKNNVPYFIFLKFDPISNRDSYQVLDFNWIKKI